MGVFLLKRFKQRANISEVGKKIVHSNAIFLAVREVTTNKPLSRYDDNQILLRTIQATEKCGCFVLKHINIPVPDWPSGMTVVDPWMCCR